MSKEITLRGAGLPSLSKRQTARAIARLGDEVSIELARTRSSEVLATARIEAIGAVSTIGLIETADLSSTEMLLAQRTPHAIPRLQMIADSAAFNIAAVVRGVGRRG
jgi:hypothetical protein